MQSFIEYRISSSKFRIPSSKKKKIGYLATIDFVNRISAEDAPN
jgi:hypothetical protein